MTFPSRELGAAAPGGSALAPSAPGRLGEAVTAQEGLAYLEALQRWVSDRKRELDDLDGAALRVGPTLPPADTRATTADLMLSLALWKAVNDRLQLMLATWDFGRVGEQERLRLASLIWGRLEDRGLQSASGANALAVSVPEACRLSDALAHQLRVRLHLEQSGLEVAERVRALRAQLERIRDQIRLEPPATRDTAGERLNALAVRVSSVLEKLSRGGDVGGLVGPIEIEAATFERDLIVGAGNRAAARGLVERSRELRADLETREAALHALVDRAVATVHPAPRYAVPDVDALGTMPNTRPELEAHKTRLEQVGRAMDVVQAAYSAAVTEHDELDGLLQALRVKASATGRSDEADVRSVHDLTRAELDRRPCRMRLARPLLALYQTYLEDDR